MGALQRTFIPIVQELAWMERRLRRYPTLGESYEARRLSHSQVRRLLRAVKPEDESAGAYPLRAPGEEPKAHCMQFWRRRPRPSSWIWRWS